MSCKTEESQKESSVRLTSVAFVFFLAALLSCGGRGGTTPTPVPPASTNPLDSYSLLGDVKYVHDPSIYQQGASWYVFSTDYNNPGGHLPVRCSSDLKTFRL